MEGLGKVTIDRESVWEKVGEGNIRPDNSMQRVVSRTVSRKIKRPPSPRPSVLVSLSPHQRLPANQPKQTSTYTQTLKPHSTHHQHVRKRYLQLR